MERQRGTTISSQVARRSALLVGVLVFSLVWPAVASAADDPYGSDPLRLIAFQDEVSKQYTSGRDVWEVWVCDFADGTVPVDVASAISVLETTIGPYFSSISDGHYEPVFQAGGVVTSPTAAPAPDIGTWFLDDCESRVAAASTAGVDGALIIANTDYSGGYANIGHVCPGYYEGYPYSCPTTYPENSRIVVVGGGTVVTVPPLGQPRLAAVAHEIGHAIGWPHSYGGLSTDELGRVSQYDNPMDLMSGERWIGLEGDTVAINRYAAGWIAPNSVFFHRKGASDYQIGTGPTAAQFLVLPTDAGSSVFRFIGPRTNDGYDTFLPAHGVEVYEVNQSVSACTREFWWEPDWPCYAYGRRTVQLPAVAGPDGFEHTHDLGTVFTVGNVTVEVLDLVNGTYTLRVSGDSVTQRFVDDNGSPHEANIETIAAAGVTAGCNPPMNDRYCPGSQVTRAEMAAFLLRVINQADALPAYQGVFSDVQPGQWYTAFVEHLFELGLTAGYADGTYRPASPVARSEIAAFLLGALGEDVSLAPVRNLFSDVPSDAWYAPYVERLYDLGVTSGCATAPLRFCPNDPVKRDQMGTFLAKVLTLG